MLDTDHPAARSVPLIAYRNFPFALAVVPCSSPWTASADAVRILAPRIRTASSCSKGFTMNHYPIAVATALHPHDVGTILDEGRVAIRAGHHCAQPLMEVLGVDATARASFAVYNGPQDIEALVKGVERVTRIFG